MKIQIAILIVSLPIRLAFSQNEPTVAQKWRTTVQMGVQAGRVRPDPPYPNYGYYYYTVYTSPQRPAGNRIGLTIHATHSYIVSSMVGVGIASGVDYYNNSAFFPVAGVVQGDLLATPHRITPFYSIESGYAFRGPNPHDKELSGGWLWSPGLGVRINKGNGTGFLISAGYKHQQARQIASVDGVQTLSQIENRRYNRLYFRMGFSF
jgi:hypothetical protein